MVASSIEKSVRRAQELLQHARHAVALTGAGISTPSGIPDFRSPQAGLWETVDPFSVASLFAFRNNPQAFFDWIRPMVRRVYEAEPNPAHLALAAMEQSGLIKAIITQNIDGLHSRAGSVRVIEVHGNFRVATCIDCYRNTPGDEVIQHLLQNDTTPCCRVCGGVLKPNVILMGEQLPFTELQRAYQETRHCDLMLVAGSSLTVEPAARFPEQARKNGARLIFVNLQPTWLDQAADVVIHADVAQILPELAKALRQV